MVGNYKRNQKSVVEFRSDAKKGRTDWKKKKKTIYVKNCLRLAGSIWDRKNENLALENV